MSKPPAACGGRHMEGGVGWLPCDAVPQCPLVPRSPNALSCPPPALHPCPPTHLAILPRVETVHGQQRRGPTVGGRQRGVVMQAQVVAKPQQGGLAAARGAGRRLAWAGAGMAAVHLRCMVSAVSQGLTTPRHVLACLCAHSRSVVVTGLGGQACSSARWRLTGTALTRDSRPPKRCSGRACAAAGASTRTTSARSRLAPTTALARGRAMRQSRLRAARF